MTVKELYDLVGGDYADLLTRLPKEELAERFVRKYVDGDEFDHMIAAFEAKDYRKVFEVSHNLKGMAANLSLVKNNKTLVEICESVRHGDPEFDISGLVEQAKEEHAKLVSLVEQLG